MKYLSVLFWTLLIALPVHAESTSELTTLIPAHQGYAFDHPRVLAQQRLFGLAHGVTLLAAACVSNQPYREPLTLAYTEWSEQQAAVIDASMHDLAHYYFADRAAEATRLDIVRALNLGDRLSLKPDSKVLHDACETFAEALHKPRFDLRNQYHLLFLAARLDAATTTEAEAEACHALLVDTDAAQLNEALAVWHTTYGAGVAEAKTALEQNWPESRIEATLEELLAQARERGKRAAIKASCDTMAARLLTRKQDPDAAFNTEP